MPQFVNLTGDRFGKLRVLGVAPRHEGLIVWLCQCDCGQFVETRGTNLRNGDKRSCGCAISITRPGATGELGARQSWYAMLRRCETPTNIGYRNYGERGITVCECWHTFENFLADMGGRPPGLTLDRIDNNEGYFPGNCRWATPTEQRHNQRRP